MKGAKDILFYEDTIKDINEFIIMKHEEEKTEEINSSWLNKVLAECKECLGISRGSDKDKCIESYINIWFITLLEYVVAKVEFTLLDVADETLNLMKMI